MIKNFVQKKTSFFFPTKGQWLQLALLLVVLCFQAVTFAGMLGQKVFENERQDFSFTVFFKPNAGEEKVEHFLKLLRANRDRGILQDFHFVSPQEVLQDFAENDPESWVFLRQHKMPNPFVPMVEIFPNAKVLGDLLNFFQQEKFASTIEQELFRQGEIFQNLQGELQAQQVVANLFFTGVLLSGFLLGLLFFLIFSALAKLDRPLIFKMFLEDFSCKFIRVFHWAKYFRIFLLEFFLGAMLLAGIWFWFLSNFFDHISWQNFGFFKLFLWQSFLLLLAILTFFLWRFEALLRKQIADFNLQEADSSRQD